MKRRNVNALAIGLLTVLMTTTVVYAGLGGDAASEKQEAISTNIVTDKTSAAAAEVNPAAQKAGIAAQLAGCGSADCPADDAAGVLASSVGQHVLDAADSAKAKEAAWEGRAIASNVEEYVYVRGTASEDGDVVGKLPRGGAGDVIEKGEDWTLLSSGSVEGYVSNDYLAFDRDALAVAEEVCSYVATVEIDNASIREAADEEAQVLDTASTGEVLAVVENGSEWVKVLSAKCVGYMSGSVVNVSLDVAEATPVVPELKQPEEAPETAAEPDNEDGSTGAEDSASAEDDAPQQSGGAAAETPAETPAAEEPANSVSNTATSNSGTFKVTAYCSCAKCCGSYANGKTATGTTVTAGRTIAVDKNVIPLGTTVYIDGVPYVAEDTGVSGNVIDLYMDSHEAALQWGVRYCTVTW